MPVRSAVPGPLYSLESNERASVCRQLRRTETRGELGGSSEGGEDQERSFSYWQSASGKRLDICSRRIPLSYINSTFDMAKERLET
ncbi:uncharacterized protein N7511_003785 [Penicillium nucicola]|uniref:uncharacterized protein n=1 Tax=Penicillium nucicola TaxID=1850975 RepID=UPI0025458A6C|nr:uncharacterized protein N7511_003785 [Penicillium nucicola]KAJ5766169.1 hypothetical protein N7511_003785 [Penicillium nucicola]